MRARSHHIILPLALASVAHAVPSIVEEAAQGVYVLRDDSGYWAGDMSRDITHQSYAAYQARKVLDASDVPAEVWARVRAARLSVFFMVRDYSWHDGAANGLDEAYEMVVNGNVHTYPTNGGAPAYVEGGPPAMAWYDHVVPVSELRRGPNEVLIRKAPSEKNDDYLYLGIDLTEARGNSAVTFDGVEWTQDRLTVPGGNGEYMVRLYLVTDDLAVRAVWRPGGDPALDDPAGLLGYAGLLPEGPLTAGATPRRDRGAPLVARLEWEPTALDPLEPVTVTVEAHPEARLRWLDADGQPHGDAVPGPTLALPAGTSFLPSGVVVSGLAAEAQLSSVAVEASRALRSPPPRINMRPECADPAGAPADRRPACRIRRGVVTLENATLRCRFATEPRLVLMSLYNEWTRSEAVRDPSLSSLFIVEIGGRLYAGSRDFACERVESTPGGFRALLTLEEHAVTAALEGTIDEEGLRLGLELRNESRRPLDLKAAFPHLAGLTLSGDGADDYYFYPLGGGIYASTPALIRTVYGDHQALYQVMDLYSPERGGGLYVRADDAEGWHKGLSLRKHIDGKTSLYWDKVHTKTAAEYLWANPLDAVEGTSFAFEYQRRTRSAGQSFVPAPIVIAAHPGDWRTAMAAYSDWAHRVWTFRPYPSRLRDVHNMIARGWADDFLFRDGKYRDDLLEPPLPGVGRTRTDCVELMSWWDWSNLGPWGTPFDRLAEVLSPEQISLWEPYFVTDPVTGQKMWNNQPGDYTGYNERFGGLPAFRDAIQKYQKAGALVTLYTDPFRLDGSCAVGREHGEQWGVVGPDGKHTRSYEVWNPCHDNPEVRQWVADTMARVMAETGADGIRLDEYGHMGWACFSDSHDHTYSERGVSQWNKAVSEATRMVRARMDEVSPGSVLTTEFPAYDYMMQFIDGCITYDLSSQACPLRPLECNIQRFYFPECRPYELDYSGSPTGPRKKLWNAVASFGTYLPVATYVLYRENTDVYAGRNAEPLVPTLVPHVYANRFGPEGSGAKTLYHLYNAAGHTVEGPMLSIEVGPDEHIFDLLNYRECELSSGNALRLLIPRDEVAVIARLQRLMTVTRRGDSLEVRLSPLSGLCRLVVCAAGGTALLELDARTGTNVLDLSPLSADSLPCALKLLVDGKLADAAELPEEAA